MKDQKEEEDEDRNNVNSPKYTVNEPIVVHPRRAASNLSQLLHQTSLSHHYTPQTEFDARYRQSISPPQPNSPVHYHFSSSTLQQTQPPSSNESRLSGSITIQPAAYQIANYNIHPIPCIVFETVSTRDQLISVELIQEGSKRAVPEGFVKGNMKEVRAGTKHVYFKGLKLNRKGVIKQSIRDNCLDTHEVTYRIRFTLVSDPITYWTTNSFTLVSNYNQLPDDESSKGMRPIRNALKDTHSFDWIPSPDMDPFPPDTSSPTTVTTKLPDSSPSEDKQHQQQQASDKKKSSIAFLLNN